MVADALLAAGVGMVFWGCWLVEPALAWIVGGSLLGACGLLCGRKAGG